MPNKKNRKNKNLFKPEHSILCDIQGHGIMCKTIFADYGEMKVFMYHCIHPGCNNQSLLYVGSINLNYLIKSHHGLV
jgi:hypothetical protein